MDLFIFKEHPPKEIKAKQHPWANTIKGLFLHRIKHAHNSITNPKYPVEEEKKPASDRVQFTVIGDRVSKAFIYCRNLVIGLHKYRWKNFAVPLIKGCSTIEWPDIWQDLKIRFNSDIANCLQSSVAVLVNGRILGGEIELQQLVESKYFYHLCLDYYNEGVTEFARFIRSTGRPFAYMHVSIDDIHIGTLIFMLYADIVPYTCENFLRLCKERRGGYGGTPVHRIVKDGWIQCGGFGLKSTPLSCENFIIPLDKRGVLAMANDGRDDDCSTQFFVLLQPAPWMNHKYVAFGQLIEGAATLEKIESVTTWYESPTSKIILYRCGILNMECHDIIINRGANEYIETHIKDLNLFCELLWEDILDIVFLKTQLRETERLKEQQGDGPEGSFEKGATKILKEDAEELALEEMKYQVEQDEAYKHQSLYSGSLVVEPRRPYYIPLTDVPYPGDVDSDFDLKRFLKGDYCLECDLDPNALRDAKSRGIIHSSLLFAWSDSDITSSKSDKISMDSDQQQELEAYLKQNIDRVSFAGGVIKSIAKSHIFDDEKQRASTFISDEELRKLRLASLDLKYREERHTKVSIAAPGAYDTKIHKKIKRRQTGFVKAEDLEKIRVFSRLHFGGGFGDDDNDNDNGDDDDDEWPKKTAVHMSSGVKDSSHAPRQLYRRPTAFARPLDMPHDDEDDDNIHRDDGDELAKSKPHKPHFATQEGPDETAHSEALMKRRPTAFVRPGAMPVDDDDDVGELVPQPFFVSKKKAIKSHFATQEDPEETAHSEALMKSRPTAFVRPGQILVDDDNEEDDDENHNEPAITTSFEKIGPKYNKDDDEEATTKPFIDPHRTGSKFADDDDKEPATKDFSFKKTGSNFAGDYDKPTTTPPVEQTPSTQALPSGAPIKRRATAFVRASDIRGDSGDASVHEVRESVLTRLFKEVNIPTVEYPGPTLKNYKPTAELHNKNLLLTPTPLLRTVSEESRRGTGKPLKQLLTLEESFDQFASIRHGRDLEHNLSSDYVRTISKFENIFTHSIRSMEYAKKRPTMSVSQYQQKNRQYQEELNRKTNPL